MKKITPDQASELAKITVDNPDDKIKEEENLQRQFLKNHGWRREDHTNLNIHEERWIPPWNGVGYCPQAMPLKSAWKKTRSMRP